MAGRDVFVTASRLFCTPLLHEKSRLRITDCAAVPVVIASPRQPDEGKCRPCRLMIISLLLLEDEKEVCSTRPTQNSSHRKLRRFWGKSQSLWRAGIGRQLCPNLETGQQYCSLAPRVSLAARNIITSSECCRLYHPLHRGSCRQAGSKTAGLCLQQRLAFRMMAQQAAGTIAVSSGRPG
jgi:hypothetical protein